MDKPNDQENLFFKTTAKKNILNRNCLKDCWQKFTCEPLTPKWLNSIIAVISVFKATWQVRTIVNTTESC